MLEKDYKKNNIKFIKNNTNLFFTKANNQAFKKALGKYILILNSDTYFIDNSIKKMKDFLDSYPKVGAIEGIEMYENKTIIETGSRRASPLIDFYELSLLGKR